MKKVLASVAMVGMVASASAANLGTNDAEFLFGQNDVNVMAMSSAEMVQTEGQLLEILGPVLDLVATLPIVGPLVSGLLTGLPLDGLLASLPAVLDAALPINVDLGIQAGALLDTGVAVNVDSALPTLLGGVL